MEEDHGTALIECGVDRVKALCSHGFVEAGTLQGHPDHAESVEAPLEFV